MAVGSQVSSKMPCLEGGSAWTHLPPMWRSRRGRRKRQRVEKPQDASVREDGLGITVTKTWAKELTLTTTEDTSDGPVIPPLRSRAS